METRHTPTRSRRWFHYAVRTALLLALVLVLQGSSCKTPMPTSDSTPPVLQWSVVRDGTGQTQEFTGSGTVTAGAGDSFTVTLIAQDPEGVKRIELGGSASWNCLQGNIGQNKIAHYATKVQNLQPDADGNVLTKIFIIHDEDPTGWTCPSGFSFAGGSATLIGSGHNYFGGVTTGQLVIQRN